MNHRDPNFLAVKTANPPNPRIPSSPHIPLVRAPQNHPQEPLVFSYRVRANGL
ncbi:hypothetical protein CY34DRAFT_446545 [Suillus luteus UH-Slu-Lm8-n1]|uniref:Uncharacterized protein n=1 Tax=Suillus luteus UH-Slu-Lm8-n1 TaxID=930992 RepID=A0A0D0ATP5_9AGAM|nr:hypothetical protein CY34DRAFT_446545 [Suillus luteus UH-Slu-Lm8-n1]